MFGWFIPPIYGDLRGGLFLIYQHCLKSIMVTHHLTHPHKKLYHLVI